MAEPPKEKPDGEEPEQKRSYYYDDAHGYEDFDPDAEDEEMEKEPPTE